MKYAVIKAWLLQAELKTAVEKSEFQFLEILYNLLNDDSIIEFESGYEALASSTKKLGEFLNEYDIELKDIIGAYREVCPDFLETQSVTDLVNADFDADKKTVNLSWKEKC